MQILGRERRNCQTIEIKTFYENKKKKHIFGKHTSLSPKEASRKEHPAYDTILSRFTSSLHSLHLSFLPILPYASPRSIIDCIKRLEIMRHHSDSIPTKYNAGSPYLV